MAFHENLVLAVDILAEGRGADGRHRANAAQRSCGTGKLTRIQHRMLLGRDAQIVAVDVPSGEHDVAIIRETRNAEFGERQSRAIVASGLDHLDPSDRRRRDGPAQTHDGHADPLAPVLARRQR